MHAAGKTTSTHILSMRTTTPASSPRGFGYTTGFDDASPHEHAHPVPPQRVRSPTWHERVLQRDAHELRGALLKSDMAHLSEHAHICRTLESERIAHALYRSWRTVPVALVPESADPACQPGSRRQTLPMESERDQPTSTARADAALTRALGMVSQAFEEAQQTFESPQTALLARAAMGLGVAARAAQHAHHLEERQLAQSVDLLRRASAEKESVYEERLHSHRAASAMREAELMQHVEQHQ